MNHFARQDIRVLLDYQDRIGALARQIDAAEKDYDDLSSEYDSLRLKYAQKKAGRFTVTDLVELEEKINTVSNKIRAKASFIDQAGRDKDILECEQANEIKRQDGHVDAGSGMCGCKHCRMKNPEHFGTEGLKRFGSDKAAIDRVTPKLAEMVDFPWLKNRYL